MKIFSGKLSRGFSSQDEGNAWGYRGEAPREGLNDCESEVKVVGAAADHPGGSGAGCAAGWRALLQ